MTELNIKFKKCDIDAIKPVKATSLSAAYDISSTTDIDIRPGNRELISTGIIMAIPEGYEGQIRGRSGLALKGAMVANAPGTIDADYRGEIKVILYNAGRDMIKITKGMRVAQLLIKPVLTVTFEETENLDDTERGVGGFGSTGV